MYSQGNRGNVQPTNQPTKYKQLRTEGNTHYYHLVYIKKPKRVSYVGIGGKNHAGGPGATKKKDHKLGTEGDCTLILPTNQLTTNNLDQRDWRENTHSYQ